MSKFINLVEAEGPRPASDGRPAAGPVYRVKYAANGPPELEGATTCLELFESSVEKYPNRPCLGFRRQLPAKPAEQGADSGAAASGAKPAEPEWGPFEFYSYGEVGDMVKAAHAGFVKLGVKPRDKIGVIGPNAPEWMMSMQAMNRMSAVTVPLYDTLGDEAMEYVIEHAATRLVVAQGAKLGLIARAMARGAKDVVDCGVVYWGTADPAAVKTIEAHGVKVLTWKELLEQGKQGQAPQLVRPKPEDLCTIMYTSGTTGTPKGVMMAHSAVVHTVSGLKEFLIQHKEKMTTDDVFLSYLTLAHIMGRVAEEYFLHVGASIGYWRGDAKGLLDDVAALRPTVFCGVPRVFERIYSGVQEQINKGGKVKQMVYNYAYWRKLYYLQAGWKHDKASIISDVLVFNKIKQKLGGRVRVVLSGAAPLPPHVEQFLRVALCAPVVQGYGLTETCAASFVTYPYDVKQAGTVGPPMPHTELRLEAVPEMGYDPTATDGPPRGEVCIRGPGVFTGYYKAETLTKEAIDAEGFFHTGDIGELTPSGALNIIDRKKNIFKLSQGEYIAVERVESAYKKNPLVEQIWIYGNSMENVLVGVVVPKEKNLRSLAESQGIEGAKDRPIEELAKDDKLNKAVLAELKSGAKEAGLKGFEEVKAILVETEAFSVENDCMTPSFKLKRPQLQKRYQSDINAMYAKLKRGS